MIGLIGQLIRASRTYRFTGKPRLIRYWMNRRNQATSQIRVLPGGARILCDFSVPYEAMVWLKQEEETDICILEKLLHFGDTFVDCGANIGLWSLVAANRVGVGGAVYAFEPNPNTFRKLSSNSISLNKFASIIRLVPTAVGDVSGLLNFRASSSHNVSSVSEEFTHGTIQVPVATLDKELNNVVVHGIKIDVEGYEMNVLQGATALLQRCKPWLCVEFNTELTRVNSLRDWNVHNFLRGYGYRPQLFANINSSAYRYLPDSWQTSGYVNLFYSTHGW